MQIKYVGMVELADASDSKSDMGNHVWVQVPLPAPNKTTPIDLKVCWSSFNELHSIKTMDTNVLLI